MKSVSSDYAGKHLSELLREVQAGEEIEIADEGRVLALLVPPQTHVRGSSEDDADAPSDEVEQAFHGD
jgi:antitoxin (DNA-binding transcriptional repressor) of toxin-antitoxin stability system